MPPVTCPDNETLRSLLLGKLIGSQLAELEAHLLRCESCALTAEMLDGGDPLIEAIALSETPSGDEDVLGPAIEQAKRLGSLLDTVRMDEIDADYYSASAVASAESQKSRCSLDFLAPAQQPDELGRLGDYRVLTVLGVGGMGLVFKGEDLRLGRPVALKMMRPKVAAKRDSKARFLREAKAAASLSHDHIVQIYHVGEHDGVPFIAMQFLAGESLKARLKRIGQLPDAEVIRIGKEVASGLAAAHEAGMIHRDIKPENIWMELKTDRAKILDFGLVRDDHSDEGLTRSGTIVGTPRYMAPEQVVGDRVDRRSDLFSLGSMLYHLAAGKPPFTSLTVPALLYSIAHSTPRPLVEIAPQIHPTLADFIMRLLKKTPEHRPDSATEVAEELARIESDLAMSAKAADSKPLPSRVPEAANQPARKPPRHRWPLAASAGMAALAMILGVIVITIRSRVGNETKIKVAEGTTTNLHLAPGREVTIKHHLPQIATSKTQQSDPASNQADASQRVQPPLAIVPFAASEAKSHQAAWSAFRGQPIEITNSIGMMLVLIPPGEFSMGSTTTPEELVELFPGSSIRWFQREYPSHTVQITQPYYLGAHEVTVAEFKQFVSTTGYRTTAETEGDAQVWKNTKLQTLNGASWRNPGLLQEPTSPVTCVSWDDAMAFCQWLSDKEGRSYRLPTESQWEYACRAGADTHFFWGDAPESGDGYLNAGDITGESEQLQFRYKPTDSPANEAHLIAPVGSFKPNPFGLHDMAGNLWEWCSDWFGDYPSTEQQNPAGPSTGSHRVSRGGSWASASWNWRSSFRSRSPQQYRGCGLGFRVALNMSTEDAKAEK